MISLNYHHLYYFYVTAKSGSIAKACGTLLLSQPAVSTQLKQLERALGSPLFERRKRRLHLTETGRVALDYAERIFDLGRELKGALDDAHHEERAVVGVGITSGAPRAFGHVMISRILEKFPSTRVLVREGTQEELLEELGDRTLDLLLTDTGAHEQGRDGFTNHVVGKAPIAFAVAPELARRHPDPPKDLNGAPFILPAWSRSLRAQVLDLLTGWGVAPKVVAEVADLKLASQLAISGLGIAPLTVFTMSGDSPPGSLLALNIPESSGLHETIYLVSRPRRWPHPVIAHLTKNFRLPLKAA